MMLMKNFLVMLEFAWNTSLIETLFVHESLEMIENHSNNNINNINKTLIHNVFHFSQLILAK